MADRRAVNKYYPPDWEPGKGTLNQYVGQHALRSRARKLSSHGILIVRFEMPFNVWCLHCHQHIGKGVRYNAEKKKIGNYFTTPILQFSFKCHMCDGNISIQTDPKHAAYICTHGVKKQAMPTTIATDTHTHTQAHTQAHTAIALVSQDVTEKSAAAVTSVGDNNDDDAMQTLEKRSQSKKAAKRHIPYLTKLIQQQHEHAYDTFGVSKKLRAKHRQKRHEAQQLKREAQVRQLSIPLLKTTREDAYRASIAVTMLKDDVLNERKLARLARFDHASTSVFGRRKHMDSHSHTHSQSKMIAGAKPAKAAKLTQKMRKLLACGARIPTGFSEPNKQYTRQKGPGRGAGLFEQEEYEEQGLSKKRKQYSDSQHDMADHNDVSTKRRKKKTQKTKSINKKMKKKTKTKTKKKTKAETETTTTFAVPQTGASVSLPSSLYLVASTYSNMSSSDSDS
jgi:coiled-coil domain-containing protein 130